MNISTMNIQKLRMTIESLTSEYKQNEPFTKTIIRENFGSLGSKNNTAYRNEIKNYLRLDQNK